MENTRLFLLIGQNMRNARQRNGMTQQELAERSGLSRQTVNKLENGHTAKLSVENLISLAKTLDHDPDDLLCTQMWRNTEPATERIRNCMARDAERIVKADNCMARDAERIVNAEDCMGREFDAEAKGLRIVKTGNLSCLFGCRFS